MLFHLNLHREHLAFTHHNEIIWGMVDSLSHSRAPFFSLPSREALVLTCQ